MTAAETKHFDWGDEAVVMSKHDINGNAYVVLVYPERWKQEVIVFAADGGADHGLPEHPTKMGTAHRDYPYRELHRDRQYRENNTPIETFISTVINDAVCKLEDKQETRRDYADKVEAALEANKKAHEGLDYDLADDARDE